MLKKLLYGFYLLIISFTLSCVSTPYFFNRGEVDKTVATILVLNFRDFNMAESNNSGELARSLFEYNLLRRGFNVIEIEKATFPQDLPLNDLSPAEIIEIGKRSGADYVVYGSVYDYKSYQSQTSFLYLFSWLEVTYSVGITARMVSCKNGEVVWSGSLSRLSYSYNDAASEATRELVKTIKFK